MKPRLLHSTWAVVALAGLTCLLARANDAAEAPAAKLRLLIVQGGHDFETNQFLRLFQDNPAVTFKVVQQPDSAAWLKPDRAAQYDVLVLYDMWQSISEEAKTDFCSLLQKGKGLVALHHSLGSYQKWDDYARIIGGRYHLEKRTENGSDRAASTYKHDVDFTVRVADPNHPVTRGLKDFPIHDETYGGVEVKPASHVLLTTDEPTSTPSVAWTSQYGAARIVCIQLGHDHQAYENPNYRRLVAQAIGWVAQPAVK